MSELHDLLRPANSTFKIEDVRGFKFPKKVIASRNGTEHIWTLNNKKLNFTKLEKWGFLAQSRTNDNLPITSIKMAESQPCNDPTEESFAQTHRKTLFAPDLRGLMKNGCHPDKTKKESHDKRYRDIGMLISEATLHKNSHVKEQLMERAYGLGGTVYFSRFKGGKPNNKVKTYY